MELGKMTICLVIWNKPIIFIQFYKGSSYGKPDFEKSCKLIEILILINSEIMDLISFQFYSLTNISFFIFNKLAFCCC